MAKWEYINDSDGQKVVVEGDFQDAASVQSDATSNGNTIRGGLNAPSSSLILLSRDVIDLDDLVNAEDGTLFMKSGDRLIESSVREVADEVDVTKTLGLKDNQSLNLGAFTLQARANTIGVINNADSRLFIPIASELQTDGSVRPSFPDFGVITDTPSPSDKSETFTGATIQFQITNQNDGQADTYTFDSTKVNTNVNFTIRLNSHADANPLYDYKRANGGEGIDFTVGENTVDLLTMPFFRSGQVLYVTVTADQGETLSLRGQTLGGETIPYIETSGRFATNRPLAYLSDIGTGTTPLIRSFNINIASRVDENTNLNGSRTITYDIIHASSLASLVLLDGNTVVSTLTTPTTDGPKTVTATLSNVVTSAQRTINFRLRGTDANTNNYFSNTQHVEVRTPAAQELAYFGLSNANNPATVDLNTLTSVEAVLNGSFDITVTPTAGQYLHVLVPSNRDVSTITERNFNVDVTNIFTNTDNVRTINTQPYNSYVLGPTQGGAESDYRVTL